MWQKIINKLDKLTIKDFIILILLSFLVFLECCIIFGHFSSYKELVERSGPTGDTIGGISGPIIGLFSIYYVYHAFKEQKLANQVLLSDLTKQNILNEISELRRDLDSIVYVSNDPMQHFTGISAVVQIRNMIYKNEGDILTIREQSFGGLYTKLTFFLEKVIVIWESVQNRKMNNEDSLFTERSIKQLLDYYLINYYPLLSDTKNSLDQASTDSKTYDYYQASDINFFISNITYMNKKFDQLEKLGLVSIQKRLDVTHEEFDDATKLKKDELEEIQKYIIEVKTTP